MINFSKTFRFPVFVKVNSASENLNYDHFEIRFSLFIFAAPIMSGKSKTKSKKLNILSSHNNNRSNKNIYKV
jgi:hypothetical protein